MEALVKRPFRLWLALGVFCLVGLIGVGLLVFMMVLVCGVTKSLWPLAILGGWLALYWGVTWAVSVISKGGL